ncbi:MAG: MFS transporter [Deltaproteobacteria bacterium]|nr:MFS transporter [Deltaproteobacteria bacterium]
MHFLRIKTAALSYGALLAICCSIAFASYLGSYMRIPVVPLFARSLGATTLEVGLINAAFLLMSGALSIPLGILSDRWGRKLLITSGLVISMATSFLLYASATPGQLIAIYLLFGTGLAAIGPTLMSYVADFSPSTHLGRSYGWYTTAIYSGMSLGPALGGFVAQWLGFRPLFLIAGFFVLLLIWVVVIFLPSHAPHLSQRPSSSQTPTFTRDLLRNRALLGCWLLTLGGCFGQGMFVTFSPLLTHDYGLSMGEIGLVFTAQAVFNALSRLPFGRLSDRVQSRAKLAALGFISFGFFLAVFGFCRTLPQFLLTSVALGVTMGLSFTPLGALIAEVAPPEARGLAMGGYNTSIYLGMMLSSAFMGGAIGKVGYETSFFLSALLVLLVTGGFYRLLKEFSGSPE